MAALRLLSKNTFGEELLQASQLTIATCSRQNLTKLSVADCTNADGIAGKDKAKQLHVLVEPRSNLDAVKKKARFLPHMLLQFSAF